MVRVLFHDLACVMTSRTWLVQDPAPGIHFWRVTLQHDLGRLDAVYVQEVELLGGNHMYYGRPLNNGLLLRTHRQDADGDSPMIVEVVDWRACTTVIHRKSTVITCTSEVVSIPI